METSMPTVSLGTIRHLKCLPIIQILEVILTIYFRIFRISLSRKHMFTHLRGSVLDLSFVFAALVFLATWTLHPSHPLLTWIPGRKRLLPPFITPKPIQQSVVLQWSTPRTQAPTRHTPVNTQMTFLSNHSWTLPGGSQTYSEGDPGNSYQLLVRLVWVPQCSHFTSRPMDKP